MDNSDDDRGSHLDGVHKGQGVRVKIPGGINSKGIDTVITIVLFTVNIHRTPRASGKGFVCIVSQDLSRSCTTNWSPDKFHRLAIKTLSFSNLLRGVVISFTYLLAVKYVVRHVRRIDIVSAKDFRAGCWTIQVSSHSDIEARTEPIVRKSKELIVKESIVHGAHS